MSKNKKSTLESTATENLHSAVCQAVTLMNVSPEVMNGKESREAWYILRQALIDYADSVDRNKS